MIGGHFDLSAGVMTGATGLLVGVVTIGYGHNVWVAVLARPGPGAGHRGPQRLAGGPHRAAQLHRHARHVPHAAGPGPGAGEAGLRHRSPCRASPRCPPSTRCARCSAAASTVLGAEHRGLRALVAAVHRRGHAGCCCAPGSATGCSPPAARRPAPGNRRPGPARTTIALFMTTAAAGWLVGTIRLVPVLDRAGQHRHRPRAHLHRRAVIGGCLLTGGFGSAIGASLGALIFGMTQLGIPYAGWDADWFYFFLGAMLLLAVLVQLGPPRAERMRDRRLTRTPADRAPRRRQGLRLGHRAGRHHHHRAGRRGDLRARRQRRRQVHPDQDPGRRAPSPPRGAAAGRRPARLGPAPRGAGRRASRPSTRTSR